jgi:hypothetical protein
MAPSLDVAVLLSLAAGYAGLQRRLVAHPRASSGSVRTK